MSCQLYITKDEIYVALLKMGKCLIGQIERRFQNGNDSFLQKILRKCNWEANEVAKFRCCFLTTTIFSNLYDRKLKLRTWVVSAGRIWRTLQTLFDKRDDVFGIDISQSYKTCLSTLPHVVGETNKSPRILWKIMR